MTGTFINLKVFQLFLAQDCRFCHPIHYFLNLKVSHTTLLGIWKEHSLRRPQKISTTEKGCGFPAWLRQFQEYLTSLEMTGGNLCESLSQRNHGWILMALLCAKVEFLYNVFITVDWAKHNQHAPVPTCLFLQALNLIIPLCPRVSGIFRERERGSKWVSDHWHLDNTANRITYSCLGLSWKCWQTNLLHLFCVVHLLEKCCCLTASHMYKRGVERRNSDT